LIFLWITLYFPEYLSKWPFLVDENIHRSNNFLRDFSEIKKEISSIYSEKKEKAL
jgi:hypothetical protein